MTLNYFQLTIEQTLESLKNGSLKLNDIIEHTNQQFNKFNNNKIFIHNNMENIIEGIDGPLKNITIAIKDNIVTKDQPTTCASKILSQDNNFNYDATLITKLRNAGALLIGKTNLDEFAMGSFGHYSYCGTAINPWVDNEGKSYVCGGSSSGSAGAVAAGIAQVAIGTDTGGSVLLPGAYCGVVAFKPTYGSISRYGVIPMANSLDTVGIFGKTVADVVKVFNVLEGKDIKDSSSIDLKQLFSNEKFLNKKKIAIIKEFNDCPDIFPTMNKVKNYLEKIGYTVEEINIPAVEYGLSLYNNIVPMEVMSNLARFDGVRYGLSIKTDGDFVTSVRGEGFGDEVKRRILIGAFMASQVFSQDKVLKTYGVKHWMEDQFKQVFQEYDFILKPTSFSHSVPLDKIKDIDPINAVKTDRYTVIANLIGSPCIHIPIDIYPNGIPLGISIMGSQLQDYNVLELAKNIDENFEFHKVLLEKVINK